MADLQTTYMGIELDNPIVVGACSLSKQIDSIRKIEDAGAGALVIKSLFEEQVQLERHDLEQDLNKYDSQFSEALAMFPKLDHGGAKEHIFWVKKAKESVSMPLIASLNAQAEDVWVDYAKQLADTGVDGLELNFYSLPLNTSLEYGEIEKKELEIFAKIRAAVDLPIAVKLHPFYTNVLKVAKDFDRLGANAIVIFNKLFQPGVNIATQALRPALMFSTQKDMNLSLRWTGLLYGRVGSDIIASSGISSGGDVVAMMLAGATAVQVVSVLYQKKYQQIGIMLDEISQWMHDKGYDTINDFRGSLSKQNVSDPWAYERGQYIKALLGFD